MRNKRYFSVLVLGFIFSVSLFVFANSSLCAAADRLVRYQLTDSGIDSDDIGTDYDLTGYNSPLHADGGVDVEFSDAPVRYYRRSGSFLDGLNTVSIVFQINAESFPDSDLRRIVSRYDHSLGQRNFHISVDSLHNLSVGFGYNNGDSYEHHYDRNYAIPVGVDVWGLVRIDGEGKLLDMLLRDNTGAALGADVIGTSILSGRTWNNNEADLAIGTALKSGAADDSRTFDGIIKHIEIYSGLLEANAFEQIISDETGTGQQGQVSTTDALVVTEEGNVGIGIASPENKLHIDGDLRLQNGFLRFESPDKGLTELTDSSHPYGHGAFRLAVHSWDSSANFHIYNQADQSIPLMLDGGQGFNSWLNTAGGNVGIGTDNPTEKLHVAGNVMADAFNSSSDARWKENIQPIDDALERVIQLRGVNYEWIDKSRGDGPQLGVIAQEVEEVFPEVIRTDSQGYKSVEYSKLVAPLIEAIKELKAENEALKNRIEHQKQELEKRISRIETTLAGKSQEDSN